MPRQNLERIRRTSRFLVWVVSAVMILLPIGILLAFLWGGEPEQWLNGAFVSGPTQTLGAVALAVIYGVVALQLAVALGGLATLRALFQSFAHGEIFGVVSSRLILRLGQWLIALTILRICSYSVISLAATWSNPEGQRSLSIAFSSADMLSLLAASLLFVIGWVMCEARMVVEENREFV